MDSGSVHILSESSQVATCVEALLGVSIVRVENTPLASGVGAERDQRNFAVDSSLRWHLVRKDPLLSLSIVQIFICKLG